MTTVNRDNGDRLRQLDQIEHDLVNALCNAGQSLSELAKDEPNVKIVDRETRSFLETLERVESEISKQLVYLTQVSTGQTHEGSCYGHQKVLNMSNDRLEHVKSKVQDLKNIK